MHTRSPIVQEKKGSRAVAHQLSRSQGRKSYASVTQRMKGDNEDEDTGIFSMIRWGSKKLQGAKQELYDYFAYGNSLWDIAAATGFGIFKIQEMLADPEPDIELVDTLLALIRKNYTYSYDTDPLTALVPAYLISDLPEGEQAKVDEIFHRINEFPFSYSGSSGDALTAFLKKSGDCSDLAEMFIYAVKAAGIHDVKMETCYGRMLVNRGFIHGRDDNCNTMGGEFWFFFDHFWCSYNGTHYDLLFRKKGYPKMKMSSGSGSYKGIPYTLFPDGRCFVQGDFLPKLGIELEPGKSGLVEHSLRDLQVLIDECLPGVAPVKQDNMNNDQL